MSNSQTNSKSLNTTLWVLQALLGAAFIYFGVMKTFFPTPPGMSPAMIRFIGISELAGGIGLILPAALRIQPKLTAWAAIGLFVIMVLATALHISRAEYSHLALPIFFGVAAALIAWGRFTKVPILAKS
jgi:uncharacterized membrane protein YphA (DoxX/SURF4 family)